MKLEEYLERDECIQKRATISKKALLVTWFSIPIFIAVVYGSVYIPYLIKKIIKKQVGMENGGLLSSLPRPIVGIIIFFISLLVIAWLIWGLSATLRHFQYELAFTEKALIARNRNKIVRMQFDKINNVFMERSIWGRMLCYGTITFVTNRESIIVRNVHNPEMFVGYVKERYQ